jgi:hypothetical protein
MKKIIRLGYVVISQIPISIYNYVDNEGGFID